jgi:hypothetical protein
MSDIAGSGGINSPPIVFVLHYRNGLLSAVCCGIRSAEVLWNADSGCLLTALYFFFSQVCTGFTRTVGVTISQCTNVSLAFDHCDSYHLTV